MDEIAVNHTRLDRALFLEGMRRVSAEDYGKSARRLLLILTALWLVLAVWSFLEGSLLTALTELLALVLAAVWILFWLPRRKARKAWEKFEARYGPESERMARFYESCLRVEGGDRTVTLDYSALRHVLRTERLLILVGEDRTGALLLREGFGPGEEDAVLERIKASREGDKAPA